MIWFRISAPHYVAALIVDNDIVIEAAPIIKWAVGKQWSEVQKYFYRKKFTIQEI